MSSSSLTSPAPFAFANTIAEFEPPVAPPHRLVLPVGFALFAVLAVAGVCGNSFLLRAIARRLTSTSYSRERAGGYVSAGGAHVATTEELLGLLQHAAIANLATTAGPLPLSLLELVLHRVGSAASLLCHVAQLAFLLCFVASACLHVALALHLVKPRCGLRRVRCCAWRPLAAMCWALAVVCAVPIFVSMLRELLEFVSTSDTYEYRSEGSNAEQEAVHLCLGFPMPAHQLYFSAALSAVFLVACVAMIITYSAALSERKNAVRNLSRLEHRMQSFNGERLNTQSSGRQLRERVAQFHSAHSILPPQNWTGIDASTAASAESTTAVHPAVAILRREVEPSLSIGSNSTVRQPLCSVDSTGSTGGGHAAIDPEADWRTARILAAVAILFVSCWTPLITLLTKHLQFALSASSFSRSFEEYVFRWRVILRAMRILNYLYVYY